MAHHQCWSFTKAPLEYPAVALGHGVPALTVPQDHSLHRPLQVIVRADGSVSQLKALDVGHWDHSLSPRVEPVFPSPGASSVIGGRGSSPRASDGWNLLNMPSDFITHVLHGP